MLDIINIHKTFNKGTINEKVALDGVTLHLMPLPVYGLLTAVRFLLTA